MKKQHLIILSLLALTLTACGKDKPVEATTAPIETIQPTEAETELNDSIDSTSEALVIQGVAIGADGKEMTPEEAAAYEESIRYENSPSLQKESTASEEVTEALNESEQSESGSLTETVPSETVVTETLSEQERKEASERDFTPEEYEQIQKSIDEWTYQEALERIKVE